jgi:hypothetical protein
MERQAILALLVCLMMTAEYSLGEEVINDKGEIINDAGNMI